jgi:two-component system NarL family sensor kinase
MSQGLYRLVHDLRPAQLDDLGLVAALQYLQDESRAKGLQVELHVEGRVRPLDPIRETVLFRVAQEALSNTLRHSGAEAATVSLEYGQGEVLLQVSDRGRGFDPSQEFNPPRGWGLAGMRERVEAIGGSLRIHSASGAGTQVEVAIPAAEERALEQGEVA